MKFRLFPTVKQQQMIKIMFEQWKWYYNFALDIQREKQLDMFKLRDIIRNYGYQYSHFSKTSDNRDILIQEIIDKSDTSKYYVPGWWNKVHTRVIRGAIHSLVSNHTSGLKKKKKFNLSFKSKKSNDILSFEDFAFPSALKQIKGYYGYRTKDRKRVSISPWSVANEDGKRGCIFIYDKVTDRYFLHYPVSIDYYPREDKRTENQGMYTPEGIISLDPGVRKFLVGYGNDSITIIGEGANKKLTAMLLELDKESDKDKRKKLWIKIKNYKDDLYWKSIKYLTDNYKDIILGDIQIQSILKGRRLPKIVKRILSQYSFYQFKQRLEWKSGIKNNNLLLIDESYTSKTCCRCGYLNNIKGQEEIQCHNCNIKM